MQNFWLGRENPEMKVKHNKEKRIMNEEKKGSKFFNGLLWGAALGGGAAYVLSNKRGCDLVKELIKDGVDLLEKDLGPQKKAATDAINPIIEEEVILAAATQEQLPEEEVNISVDKKRLFKKVTKK